MQYLNEEAPTRPPEFAPRTLNSLAIGLLERGSRDNAPAEQRAQQEYIADLLYDARSTWNHDEVIQVERTLRRDRITVTQIIDGWRP